MFILSRSQASLSASPLFSLKGRGLGWARGALGSCAALCMAMISGSGTAFADSYTISGDAAVSLAEQAILRGQLTEAEAILLTLAKAPRDNEMAVQVHFLRGLIAAARGEHRDAVGAFRDILDRHPYYVRVRFEMARSLYALRWDRAATYHFRLCLGGGLPPEVDGLVKQYLAAIDGRRVWRLQLDAAIRPDTNINQATDDPLAIEPLTGQVLNDDGALARSGLGLSSSLFGQYTPKLRRSLRLHSEASLHWTD